MTRQKTIFMTGAAGGLGAKTAKYLAQRGWHVYAGDINPDALQAAFASEKNITPIVVDVTNRESIDRAKNEVTKHTNSLDAVLNFAGILGIGVLAEIDESLMQRVLDINVMGTFRVNQIFLPLVIAGKGRIINTSSETGWQPGMPFNGPYAMSKHAIEAYSDSLRRELMLIDIPVIKLQPGPFKTNMTAGIKKNFETIAESSKHFARAAKIAGKQAITADEKASDPTLLAEAVYKALTAAHPKAAYSIKPDPARAFISKLPVALADKLIKKSLS